MIDFTSDEPLRDAVESLSQRTPLGSVMSSAEWERVPVEIKRRTFWVARMENERVLAEMQRRLQQRIELGRDEIAKGGRGMNRARFIEEMQAILEEEGYEPPAGKEGGLRDHSSAVRLGFVWDMQIQMAEGYARWKAGLDPDVLEAVPCLEFVRLEERHEERPDWPARWKAAGGEFYGDEPNPYYPSVIGRMIAPKGSDVWVKLSRFGVPWRPYDWGSGMGERGVRWRESVKLGVINPDGTPKKKVPKPDEPGSSKEEEVPSAKEQPKTPDLPSEAEPRAPGAEPAASAAAPPASEAEPVTADLPFNTKASASTQGLPRAAVESVQSDFGDHVKVNDAAKTITLESSPEKDFHMDLEERSAALAKELQEEGEDRPEVIAPLVAVATGRRLLAVVPASASLPRGVDAVQAGEQLLVFRKDRIAFAVVAGASASALLVWQALATPEEPSVNLVIRGPKGQVLTYLVPAVDALRWAKIRLRDFAAAFGPGWAAFVNGKEVKP